MKFPHPFASFTSSMQSSGTTNMPTPSVLDIQEILQQILSFLDQKSLCTSARLVCKKWLAASSLTAHRVVMIQTYSSKPNNVTSLLKTLPYAGGLLWVENDSAAAWPQLVPP
ncbi:hypothetical protein BG000_008713 [Podila horticola]|nr:hypothetical protein BG000_008713 [Podila horticola]